MYHQLLPQFVPLKLKPLHRSIDWQPLALCLCGNAWRSHCDEFSGGGKDGSSGEAFEVTLKVLPGGLADGLLIREAVEKVKL